MKRSISLYIHVPFCNSVCPYCDFYKRVPRENDIEDYVDAIVSLLKREEYDQFYFDTLYFGGGTPSVLSASQLEKVFSALSGKIKGGAEITLECNPKDADKAYYKDIFSLGINRLSLGAQSLDDELLKFLGRRHTEKDIHRAVEDAFSSGFKNITLDMMIGVPHMNLSHIDKWGEFISHYDIPHISSYILKIEEGTAFHKRKVSDILPSDDEVANQYLYTAKVLSTVGLQNYEISNYSKEGYEGKHNLKYWYCSEYLGLGPGAHSFLDGKRFYCENNLYEFIQKVNENKGVFTGFSDGGTLEEYAMLRLRLREGLIKKDAVARFGDGALRIFERAKAFPENDFFILDQGKISLTERGFLLSNQIIERLVF